MTKKVKGKNKTKQSVRSFQALQKLHIRLMDERQNAFVEEIQKNKDEHACKPAWRENASQHDGGRFTQKTTEETLGILQSVLHKITPESFRSLMQQVKYLNLNTEDRLKGAIELILDQAVSEPDLCATYARMCRELSGVNMASESGDTSLNFFNLLLRCCQQEFLKDRNDDEALINRQKELDDAQDEEERQRLKREMEAMKSKAHHRSLSLIIFFGELFKVEMLKESIMHECINKLLSSCLEDSFECFCKLLPTCGKQLDTEEAKPQMDQYFSHITRIIKKGEVSRKVRILLQDLLDLRMNNWVSQRPEEGPRTIQELHQDAALQKERELIHIEKAGGEEAYRTEDDANWRREAPENNWRRDASENSWRRDASESSLRRDAPENSLRKDAPENSMRRDAPERSWRRDAPKSSWRIDTPDNNLRDAPESSLKIDAPESSWRRDAPQCSWRREAPESTLRREVSESNWKIDAPDSSLRKDSPQSSWRREAPESSLKIDAPQRSLRKDSPQSSWRREAAESTLKREAPKCNWRGETPKSTLRRGSPESNWMRDTSKSSWRTISEKCTAECEKEPCPVLPTPSSDGDVQKGEECLHLSDAKNFTPELTNGQSERQLDPTEELKSLLQQRKTNEQIIEWIQNNMDDIQLSSSLFVRALLSAVCTSVIISICGVPKVNCPEMLERSGLLKAFLKEEQMQLQALDALQELTGTMKRPQNLMWMFLDILWDEDIVSETTFFKWEHRSRASSLRFFSRIRTVMEKVL